MQGLLFIPWKDPLIDRVPAAPTTNVKPPRIRIISILLRSFGTTVFLGCFMKTTSDCCLFAGPQILRLFIRSIVENQEPWKGYLWSGAIFALGIIQTTVSDHYFRQMRVAGFQMRTAVVSALYRKTLTLSSHARGRYTTGEICNLMSIDAQRLVEVLPHVNIIWAGPLNLALAIYFLEDLVGNSALVGIGVLFLCIPINFLMSQYEKKLQIRLLAAKDKRILLMNEVLQGIKVLKLYAWELPFIQRLTCIRESEIACLLRRSWCILVSHITFGCCPSFITLATFGSFVMIDPENNVLTSERVFACMAIFNILRIPMYFMPKLFMEAARLFVAMQRIDRFLNGDDLEDYVEEISPSSGDSFVLDKATLTWHGKEEAQEDTLKEIDLKIEKGSLIAVLGRVGSGKSSLLSAILGEMNLKSGKVQSSTNRIAYVPQQAWIQNMTVEQNILFGREMNQKLYYAVIENCQLYDDLQLLPAGDETQIGENGVNLSGGQKQRLSLARAVYSDPEGILMDDPLSAVDSHVAENLFNKVIGPNGMMKTKTRVLVTHNTKYLSQMDKIVLMDGGKIVEQGTYGELMKTNILKDFIKSHQESEESDDEIEVVGTMGEKQMEQVTNMEDKNKIVKEETSLKGRVSFSHYWYYFRKLNIIIFTGIIVLFVIAEFMDNIGNIFLSHWTDAADVNPQLPMSTHYYYIFLCLGLTVTRGFIIGFRDYAYWTRTAKVAGNLHDAALNRVMHSSMGFFEATPSGRTLNRFSSDLSTIEMEIPLYLDECLYCTVQSLGVFALVTYTTPHVLIFLVPICIMFGLLGNFFSSTKRQLKRYEAVSRSPIYSQFMDCVQGASCIRAFGEEPRFLNENEEMISTNVHSSYLNEMVTRWLSLRIAYLGNGIVLTAACCAVYFRDSLSPGLAALAITFAMTMLDSIGWAIRQACELETTSVALERIREYEELEQEPEWFTEKERNWITDGAVSFEGYSTRYRSELDEILKDLTFEVSGGEKIGICGRTGAGKSSLTLALFRMLEASKGRVLIDGRDIRSIGLQDLRSQLTIIPQDPVLFSGPLRLNLDPTGESNDAAIWEALGHAHLASTVSGLQGGLEHEVSEGGRNFSVGQRQLICLARALLRRSKILVMDEATAAMDSITDETIQKTMREEFGDCTVLTIAHRLNTIMHSDRIVVLAEGKIIECGKPEMLLKDSGSAFYDMCKNAGIVP